MARKEAKLQSRMPARTHRTKTFLWGIIQRSRFTGSRSAPSHAHNWQNYHEIAEDGVSAGESSESEDGEGGLGWGEDGEG